MFTKFYLFFIRTYFFELFYERSSILFKSNTSTLNGVIGGIMDMTNIGYEPTIHNYRGKDFNHWVISPFTHVFVLNRVNWHRTNCQQIKKCRIRISRESLLTQDVIELKQQSIKYSYAIEIMMQDLADMQSYTAKF